MAAHKAGTAGSDYITLQELLGEGTFGKVGLCFP